MDFEEGQPLLVKTTDGVTHSGKITEYYSESNIDSVAEEVYFSADTGEYVLCVSRNGSLVMANLEEESVRQIDVATMERR